MTLDEPADLAMTLTAPRGKRITGASLVFTAESGEPLLEERWTAAGAPGRTLEGVIRGLPAQTPCSLRVTLDLESGEPRGPHQIEVRGTGGTPEESDGVRTLLASGRSLAIIWSAR